MTAPHPPLLDYPFAAPPAARRRRCEVAPGVLWLRMPLPFALDHINLWLLRERRRLHARRPRLRRRADARAVGAPLRGDARAASRSRASSRRTTIPITSATPRGSPSASAARVAMTQAEFLTAHAIIDERAALRRRRRPARCSAAHGMADDARRGAARRAATAIARGVPELPATFERMLAGDASPLGGPRLARHRRLWPLARARVALLRATLGVLISGDMLLPRISTNVSVWPADPDGDPLARFLALARRVRGAAADTLVLPSHGLPFRGIALRVAQLRAHHAARLAELEAAHRAPRARRGRRPTCCRCCSAARSTCSSASSRWARRSPISTTCGAQAGSDARRRRRRRSASPRRMPRRSPARHADRENPCPTPATAAAVRRAPAYDPVALAESLASAAEKSAKLMGEFAAAQRATGHARCPPTSSASARRSWSSRRRCSPIRRKLAEAQMNLWWDYMNLWQCSMLRMHGRADRRPSPMPAKGDKRFKHEDWQEHFLFDYVKQSYLIAARWLHDQVASVEGLRRARRRRRSTSSRASTSTRWRRRTSR